MLKGNYTMKSKKLIAAMAAVSLLIAGCNQTQAGDSTTTPPAETATQSPSTQPVDTPTSPDTPAATGELDEGEIMKNLLDTLTKDEYDGLVMSAEILQRKATVPGDVVPVTVLVENKGDKTIAYTHGSGSAETPQALFAEADGLQVVLPKDMLGPMTLDMQTKQLKPGEQLRFTVNVMAIKPHAEFDGYTHTMHGEDGKYIAEVPFDELKELLTGLEPAPAGSYGGSIFFLYFVVDESAEVDLSAPNSGYAEANFTINVTE